MYLWLFLTLRRGISIWREIGQRRECWVFFLYQSGLIDKTAVRGLLFWYYTLDSHSTDIVRVTILSESDPNLHVIRRYFLAFVLFHIYLLFMSLFVYFYSLLTFWLNAPNCRRILYRLTLMVFQGKTFIMITGDTSNGR